MDKIDFARKFNLSLRNNQKTFKNDCISLVNQVSGTYRSIVIWNAMQGFNNKLADYIPVIKKTFDNNDNFVFSLRDGSRHQFAYNEIKVNVHRSSGFDIPDWGTEKYKQMIDENKDLNYQLSNKFWQSETDDAYNKFALFNCYEDYFVEKHNIPKTVRKEKVNIAGWVQFFDDLFKHFNAFFDQKYVIKSKIIYYKIIERDFFFGFSYSPTKYKKSLLREGVCLPEDMELVFGLIANFRDVISLGIYGNPLFFYPCYPMSSFKVVEFARACKAGIKEDYKLKDEIDIEGNVYVRHSKIYGDSLKRHAYLYVSSLVYTTNSYLRYVEESLRQSIV
jgi:hypothetical protein